MHARQPLAHWVTATLLLGSVTLVGCSSDSEAAAGTQEGMMLEVGGQEETGPYDLVAQFPMPLPNDRHSHDGWTWGSAGSVYAESNDRIWIAQRGELPLPEGNDPWTPYALIQPSRGSAPPTTDGYSSTCQYNANNLRGYSRRWEHSIFVVDSRGQMVDEWPMADSLFALQPCGRGPHKIKISPYDAEKHVWIIDDQLHRIYRFTYDGQLEFTLGELGVRGRGPNNFDRPTDIAWLPDGTYFISDGYGGTRVAKFDANDNFLMDWGQPPVDPDNPGPNEWNTVHSIAISEDRRLYVADRAHRRIQVFDENGTFLFMFSLGERSLPYAHEILRDPVTNEEFIWVADGGTGRILKYDLEGHYLYGWGAQGNLAGQFNGPHAITTDPSGNFYTAEVFAGRVQKFTPRATADPAKMAGQHLRTWQ